MELFNQGDYYIITTATTHLLQWTNLKTEEYTWGRNLSIVLVKDIIILRKIQRPCS